MQHSHKMQNDHYVSQMFLKNFCDANEKLMRYDVRYGGWKPKGTSHIFSYNNYNGLLSEGVNNRNLDIEFTKLEKYLPQILQVFRGAMKYDITIEPFIYKALCAYLTWIYMLSPIFKAHSPLILLQELNKQMELGEGDLVAVYFQSHHKMLACLRKGINRGMKIVFDAPNSLNLIHKLQVKREWEKFANALFLTGKLTMWHSPINVPMSDSAMLPAPTGESGLTYFLPVSPRYILMAQLPKPHVGMPLSTPSIERKELKPVEANELVDWICFTANRTLISRFEMPDIKERIARTAPLHPEFRRMQSPDDVLRAGLKDFKEFRLRLVSPERYDAFLDGVR